MDNRLNFEDLANKLFCTFTTQENLPTILEDIKHKYQILFNKIFVLHVLSTEEYVCTYNVDSFNVTNDILPGTILLHRKKESNTLYTINALNALIKSLNGGIMDNNYIVNWNDYRNCILLTRGDDFKKLDTKIHQIVNL
jgi:uncharacterized protein YfkK (UPF0435 family)